MTKEQYKDDEVLRLDYFHNLFVERKRIYPVSYFLFATYTRKKHIKLHKTLFRKIISTYLNVYFNEFYYSNKPKYFMLSGVLDKVKGSSIIINSKKGIFKESNSIGWIWYLRPSVSFVSNVRLIKLKGSTSRLNKLEKKYILNNDIALLSPINKAIAKIIKQNKLSKND